MDGKGREGTYNFSHNDLGQPGAGNMAQWAAAPPPTTPLAPPMMISNCLYNETIAFSDIQGGSKKLTPICFVRLNFIKY